jgi:hypothetical protein
MDRARVFDGHADWKSAIQQIRNLRYNRKHYCGCDGFLWYEWHVAHESFTPPAGLWHLTQVAFVGRRISAVSRLVAAW